VVLRKIRRFLRIPLRDGVTRFFGVLDSEGVVFFQTLVYVHLAWGGLYCAVIARGVPASIEQALGTEFNTAWLWLCIGVTTCLGGKIMSARRDIRPVWMHNSGLYVQLAGDLAAFGAFTGYVLATWQESKWGAPVIAVWVFVALAEYAFFLCWRDIRRISQAERSVR